MKIYYCGRQACEKGHFFGPAVRTHYLIHFVMKGKGIYKTEYGLYEVHEGEAFLIRPEEKTYYKADSEKPWSYAWVAFDGEETAVLLSRYYPDIYHPVCTIGEMDVSFYFEKLLDSFGNTTENRERVLGYFYLIMSCLTRSVSGVDRSPVGEEGYYKKACAFIRHNYSYQIQIRDVAGYVGIDRTYLYRIFMHQAGKSPKQYLSQYRLSEAKEMLYNTEYQITEIAYSCGYHDSSAFCRHFQKEMRMTPAEYRRVRKYKTEKKQREL